MKNLQHEDLLFFFMSSFWNIHFEPLISTGCSLVIVPITSSALEVTQVFQILVTFALHIYISLSLSLFLNNCRMSQVIFATFGGAILFKPLYV